MIERTLRALALLSLIVTIAGCALFDRSGVRRAPHMAASLSEPAPEPPEERPEPVRVASVPDLWPVHDESYDAAAYVPLDPQGNPVEDPVSESPLDELGDVLPELSREELERERARVAALPPTFDIPVPMNDRVLAWVDLYSGNMRQSFEKGMARSGAYLDRFRQIFREEGVPQDLVYMAAVESGFKTSAYSRAHARGIFQFIAATGRRYGLRVDYWVDERSDPEKSARAAARYMRDLYEEFEDWHLALAAYNAGEGKVRRAIRRVESRDFWRLARTSYLRRETKNHVPAVLAATILYKRPAQYGLFPEREEVLRYDTVEVEGAADLRVIAKCAGTDVETLRALNPALRRYQTPPDGTTDIHVPPGAGEQTLLALADVPLSERILYQRYQVRRGDTLSTIARRYGVSIRAIQDSNGLGNRTLIRERQVLKIPTASSGRYGELPAMDEGEVVVYRVRRGDTLSGIARRYGTSATAIARSNGISTRKLLQIGEKLRIERGAGSAGASASANVVHTVRRGDTLWDIARRYRTSVAAICRWNDISPGAILKPGHRLRIAG